MASGQETIRAAILISARMNTRDFEQGAAKIKQETAQMHTTLSNMSAFAEAAGNKWLNAGSALKRISDELTPMVELYADFDDSMRATQGKLATATAADMARLEEAVRTWAEETRFGAVETADAVKEAASSGWELTEIYEGIPTVMTLAATSGMDLTDAMEYLNSALAGLDMGFEHSETLVDQWVMASNRSRASVEDMGEAMQRLGSLMTLTESSEEVLTLLSVMAEYGTKGSEAGTLLRNVMIRLIAPTQKAADMMETLELSAEELDEVASMDLEATAEAVEKLGLSAYNSEGDLKSIVQVVNELREATAGMTEEEMYQSLAAIFPTRTLRGIMDLLRTSEAEYEAIQARITNSAGYASTIADLQEGGIGGAIREFESRVEEFKLTFGEAMAPSVGRAADALGNLISRISDMPQGVWDTIGRIGAGIIEAAPVLTAAGGTLLLMSKLLTPSGALIAGGMLLVGIMDALYRWHESKAQEELEEAFGNVTLDVAEMQQAIDAANRSVSDQQTAVNELVDTIKADGDLYVGALSQMTQSLTEWTITGQTLTQEQQESLESLGAQMIASVGQGIEDSELAHMNMLDLMFGTDKDDRGVFSGAVLTANEYYQDLYADWREVGEDLTHALTEALLDGTITPEEEAGVQAQIDKLSELQTRIQEGLKNAEYAKAVYRASGVSLESWGEFAAGNAASLKVGLASIDEEYGAMAGAQGAAYMHALEQAKTDEDKAAIQKEWDEFNRSLYSKQAEQEELERRKYAEVADRALMQVVEGLGGENAGLLLQSLTQNGNLEDMNWASALGGMSTADALEAITTLQNLPKSVKTALLSLNLDANTEGTGDMLQALLYGRLDSSLYDWQTGIALREETARAEMAKSRDEATIWESDAILLTMRQRLTEMGESWDATTSALTAKATEMGKSAAEALVRGFSQASVSTGGGGSTAKSGSGRSSILSRLGFAEGGRATQPSIFGEAGPEWAIPEEHSARTLSLLKAAARASGFAAAVSGAATAAGGGGTGAATIVYSPVINAKDARGVDAALREDKERLDKWWKERIVREEAEAF